MSEITEYLSEYLKQMNSYMKRLENNELSRKDRKLFFELSMEYYDTFQLAEGFPKELQQMILEFSDNITNQSDDNRDLARKYRDDIEQRAKEYIDASLRNELQYGIFKKDVEILNLQKEKIQMLQELTDLDMKMYGKPTEQTKEILEVQHCEIFNGRVREVPLWEQIDSALEIAEYQEKSEMNAEIMENLQEKNSKQEHQRVILKFPYMTRDTFMAVKDEIKRMGAKFDPGRKKWYVDQSVGKETLINIQDYINKHDEAIYLKLPLVEPQEFKKIIDQIKRDGARYNSDKKRWYITENDDRKKFWIYLPTYAMLFKPEKESVHGKLNQYKIDADKQKQQGDCHLNEGQKRETPELV